MKNQCTCGRSLTDNCVGWGDLSHSEWQTRKLIVEAQLAAKKVQDELARLIFPDGDF
jgi:3-deoxy-D-arabino-heptulosonate 7-phosphate (DAHP) synthase|tara:strand:- start:59 stop:229 length:171 start_codon:yes stop_codon:yes gene_type:complete